MPASPLDAVPVQLDASQFHPEFGYLAPTIRFRRQFAQTLKATILGILLGAGAMFFVIGDRAERATVLLSAPMLSAPIQSAVVVAPAALSLAPPVLSVTESIGLRGVMPGRMHTVAGPAIAAPATVLARPAVAMPIAPEAGASDAALDVPKIAAPAPAAAKAVVRPKKKKVVRDAPERAPRGAPLELIPLQGRPLFGFGR